MQLPSRYMSPWEQYYEGCGPMREEASPPGHWCEAPCDGPAAHRSPVVGGELRRLWDVVGPVVEGKTRIIDMGCGPPPNRLEGALGWDIALGHDMRDVRPLYEAPPFDLVLSSHSVEHIPSCDVPHTLVSWLGLLGRGGELFLSGPHICSRLWSPLCDTAQYGRPDHHSWAATASAVGNLLVSRGAVLLGYETHRCRENSWWVDVRKP